MKLFYLIFMMAFLCVSCSADPIEDDKRNITQADLEGEFYLYHDNQMHGLTQGDFEVLGECEADFLEISSGTIKMGDYTENCGKEYTINGSWSYVGESDNFENAIVINIKSSSYGGDYAVEHYKDGIYKIYDNDKSFASLTRAGYYAGYWKKK